MHKIIIRPMLIVWLANQMSGLIADVETVFLYRKLDEGIYVNAPQRFVPRRG